MIIIKQQQQNMDLKLPADWKDECSVGVFLGTIGTCACWLMILGVLLCGATLSLGIYYTVLYDSEEVYPILTSLVEVPAPPAPFNDTYQASMQCTGPVLQNVTLHCGGYDTLVPCAKFPSKETYTEISFVCPAPEFIEFLESQVGEPHTEIENEYAFGLGIAMFLLAPLALICGIVCLGLTVCVCCLMWELAGFECE